MQKYIFIETTYVLLFLLRLLHFSEFYSWHGVSAVLSCFLGKSINIIVFYKTPFRKVIRFVVGSSFLGVVLFRFGLHSGSSAETYIIRHLAETE